MKNSIQQIYENHHTKNRPQNFSILEDDRGELLKQNVGIGKKVLDIGCRDGVLTKHFVKGNEVLGADIDNVALDKARNNLGIETIHVDLNGDWSELSDKRFDVIVAGEILEHLYYPESVVKKVFDHLNKRGVFLGSIPNAFSLKNRFRYLFGSKKYTPLSDPTHINQFSYFEIKDLLYKYFPEVEVIGLGRYSRLARKFPSFFGFDLFFVCKKS